MKRTKKQGRRGAGMLGTGGALVIGGVTPGSTRQPPGSSRTGAGRLGRAMKAATKKSPPRTTTKPTTAKALARWENEGGRDQKPAAATTGSPKGPVKKAKHKGEQSEFLAPVPPDRGRQRRADTRAKGSQIKQAGLESRLLGHVSGSGKRNQARRDSKN
jgi:hypothetical protein